MMQRLMLIEKIRHQHRFWRYERRTERDSIQFIKGLDLRGATVLDIGANKGVFSYWLSKCVGATGHVVAFEAQPELQSILSDVERWFLKANFDIRMVALSDSCGTTTFNREFAGHGGGSIESKSPEHVAEQAITVEMTTLDAIQDSFPRPVRFIKCDVEGHELSVFKGAAELLQTDKPTILVEIHQDQMLNVNELLKSYGFVGAFISQNKRIPIDEFADHPYRKSCEVHRNYIFEPTS